MSMIIKNFMLNRHNQRFLYNFKHFTIVQTNASKNLSSSVLKSYYGHQRKQLILQSTSIVQLLTKNASTSPRKNVKVPGKFQLIEWRGLAVVSVIGGLIYAYFYFSKKRIEKSLKKQKRQIIGKADIGGDFELYDHDNNLVHSDSFRGCWILIYFGFTHCPDICPDELEKIAKVVDILDKAGKNYKMQPLFISVDPKRDSAAAIKKYIGEFHSKFIGLTGTTTMIAAVCKKFRVYFSEGPKDDDNDYIVDHTIVTYLLDPEGGFVDYYGQNVTAEQIAAKIMISMTKFSKMASNVASFKSRKTREELAIKDAFHHGV